MRRSVLSLAVVVLSAPLVPAGVTVYTDEASFVAAVGPHALLDFESEFPGTYGTSATLGGLTFASAPSILHVNTIPHPHGAANTTPSGSRYLFAESMVPAMHDDLTMGIVGGELSAWGATFTDLEVGPITFLVDGTTVHTEAASPGSGLVQFFGFVADPGESFGAVTLRVPDITYGVDDVRTLVKSCEYGAGCAGTGGFVPYLTSTPCGTVDVNQQLVMTLSGARGGANATLFFGLQEVALPVSQSGCTLHVLPLLVNVTVPLGGSGPGAGFLSIAGVLPPSAAGLGFKAQAFVLDPAGIEGFAASNGLSVQVN